MITENQGAFRAIADPTRRMILKHLSKRDMSIGDVADHFEITRAAIKKHLLILEEGKLISVQTVGRERINRLEPDGLKTVAEWVTYFDQFWGDRLSKLQSAVEDESLKRGS